MNQGPNHFGVPQALHVNSRRLPALKDYPAAGVDSQVLAADVEGGWFVVRLIGQPGASVPTHLHTGVVHAFTLSGKWQYREYPESPANTTGSYLFEPAGSRHTLQIAPDAGGPTEILFVIYGALVNFDEHGAQISVLDAATALAAFQSLPEAHGADAARVIVGGQAGYSR
jgi:quercetin dioxygenase-like cupin family protein